MRAGVAEKSHSTTARSPWFTGRGIAAAAFVFVAVVICVRLGFWQLERQEQRDDRNSALSAAMAMPPLELNGHVLRSIVADPESYIYRRVQLEGVFDPTGELVLRGRAYSGSPGVHLVTPLLLPDGLATVLVNRGWVPSPDASTVDPRPFQEPGIRTIEGILQPIGSSEGREAWIEVNGVAVRTVQRLDLAALNETSETTLLPLLVQQVAPVTEGDGAPRRLPEPTVDRGPHLGYAVQWFSFAAIAILGFGLMLHLSRRVKN
ncbi:SURF1 family protein [soil metagenome]